MNMLTRRATKSLRLRSIILACMVLAAVVLFTTTGPGVVHFERSAAGNIISTFSAFMRIWDTAPILASSLLAIVLFITRPRHYRTSTANKPARVPLVIIASSGFMVIGVTVMLLVAALLFQSSGYRHAASTSLHDGFSALIAAVITCAALHASVCLLYLLGTVPAAPDVAAPRSVFVDIATCIPGTAVAIAGISTPILPHAAYIALFTVVPWSAVLVCALLMSDNLRRLRA